MVGPLTELRERLLRAGVAPRHVRRYLTELADHLADLEANEGRIGRSRAEAESAALVRLGGMDDLAKAMIEQDQFQSWCARAPWAMFGLVPVVVLAGSYLLACLILWSGWSIFLPGTDTPFVRLQGPAIFYFGVGKLIYFGAPIFTGWGIGVIAARQRFNVAWPAAGLVLIALIGVTARVHASGAAIPGGVGHISMNFAFQRSGLFHAAVIVLITILPYLIWMFRSDARLILRRK
jgi:hypothetical protein